MKKGATLGVAALSYFSCRGGRVEGAKNKNGSGFMLFSQKRYKRLIDTSQSHPPRRGLPSQPEAPR